VWCGVVVWWCGFLTDYKTTPTKVVLSCFGLLVGLWQQITERYTVGRCEKLILHLTLGGLGDTALFDLLEGKNTKDFQKLIKEKYDICKFKFFHFKKILRPNQNHRLESLGPNASLDTKILNID
jgi:hypothetical protein